MQEMIDERRSAETKPDTHDLFSKLLDANMEESSESNARLTDNELIGTRTSYIYLFNLRRDLDKYMSDYFFLADIFIFLLAGHEVRFIYLL